jgi:hypothetical protein
VGKPDESIGNYQPSVCSNQHQINRELVAEGWCGGTGICPRGCHTVSLGSGGESGQKRIVG